MQDFIKIYRALIKDIFLAVEGGFSDVPTNPAQISPKSLIRVSVHSFGAKDQG